MDTIKLTQPAIIAGNTYPAGTEIEAVPAAVDEGYAAYKREQVRAKLNAAVGDSDTQQGTIGDTAQFIFVEYIRLIEAMGRAKNLDELRTYAKGRADAFAVLSDGLAKGSVKFPFQRKGEEKVIDEIGRRATATAATLVGEDVAPASGVVSPASNANEGQPTGYNSPTKNGHVTANQQVTEDRLAAPAQAIPYHNA